MVRSVGFWGILPAILLAGIAMAEAQENRNLAATDLSQVDEDFAYQGEFAGYARIAAGGRWLRGNVGLQVIALGDASFDAVLYTGGLPGAGWNGSHRVQLSGTREGNLLRLVQGPLQIDVNGRWAEISYPGYNAFSQIKKVERVSPTAGKRPPRNAIVLFDGTDAEMFKNGRVTDDGLLMEGADTRDAYQDFTLHLEFRLPYMPYARGQGRSNSGVYLQSRYEVQILDSFGLEGAFNECGALYRQRPPALNMCFPPLSWQTYDLTLTSPKFDEAGSKTENARITVRLNGVLVHDDVELTAKTGAGRPEGPEALPTKLQNHNNPVRFRNIWLVEQDGTTSPDSGSVELLAQDAASPRNDGSTWPGGTRRIIYDPRMPQSYSPMTRPLYPKPLYQHYQTVYDPRTGSYIPVDYYSPVAPDYRGYWTW